MAEGNGEAMEVTAVDGEGSSASKSLTGAMEISVLDTAMLIEQLSKLTSRWYEFGLQLNVTSFTLHELEKEPLKEDRFKKLMEGWLSQTDPAPSWATLLNALKQLQEEELATKLAKEFGVAMETKESGEGSTGVPDYKTQSKEIHPILQQRLQKGQTWYLVDMRWMKQWRKYVGYDTWDQTSAGEPSANPGPVDNSNLFKESTSDALKEHLMEELDYYLLPQSAWDKFVSWYGHSASSRPIARKVVEHGLYMKHCKVEVYLLEFKLCLHPKLTETYAASFSRADTVADLEVALKERFGVAKEVECRVWHRYMTHTYELLSKPTQSLQDAGLYNGQTIVLEQKGADGTWPRASRNVGYSQHSTRSSDDAFASSGKSSSGASGSSYSSGGGGSYWGSSYSQQPTQPGLCGLSNLGNTCFMNSALQCMGNTPSLTEYFLSTQAGYKPYKKHINTDNPLGMGGAIAEAYGALLEDMWSGKFNCVAPRQFKTQVGRYAPQFVGYAQHDSHELLAFLLDGLHEDLNLIKKKPYVDLTVKTEDREEEDIAEESWHKYLLRNQSVIVSLFQGQLRSTLVCPKCSKKSKTFDPFMFLSLPLPVKKTRAIFVTLVRVDPQALVVKYKLKVPKRGSNILNLKKELTKLTNIEWKNMEVIDVYNSRFHRVYQNNDPVTHILDRDDIYVYELPPIDEDNEAYVPVYFREETSRKVQYSYSTRYRQLFGMPLVVKAPKQCTYRQLYDTIAARSRKLIKPWSEVKAATEENTPQDDQMSEDGNQGNMNESEDGETKSNKNVKQANGNHGNTNETADEERDNNTQRENKSNKNESNQSDQSDQSDKPGEAEETAEKVDKEADFFSLVIVNSYGSQDVQRLKEDAKVTFKLSSQTYVACDWLEDVRQKCYNSTAEQDVKEHESCEDEKAGAGKTIHLYDCLRLFTVEETLGVDDEWYCPVCKEHVQASKKFDLWKVPEILVIHLKRFNYDRFWRDKLDVMVDFPVNGLDLTELVQIPNEEDEPLYDLFAVSNHFGGLGGGHYTACAKNRETGKWYNFDDSHVSEISEDRLVTSAAYVLFYQRRSLEGRPHQLRPKLDRTLSQSFAEESRRLHKKFHPTTPSQTEEDEEMECDNEGKVAMETKGEKGEGEVFEEATPPSSLNDVD